jgi:hypothetical protein
VKKILLKIKLVKKILLKIISKTDPTKAGEENITKNKVGEENITKNN